MSDVLVLAALLDEGRVALLAVDAGARPGDPSPDGAARTARCTMSRAGGLSVAEHDTPGGMPDGCCSTPNGGANVCRPGARAARGRTTGARRTAARSDQPGPRGADRGSDPSGPPGFSRSRHGHESYGARLRSMDAKQVWRAALGELQVSLSPANFETWLKDTALVAVDDNHFRIAVPNGFAKDWLETRYRSLISQTLARVVGYSVIVEFEVREFAATGPGAGGRRGSPAQPDRPRGARPRRRAGGRLRQPQPALHVPHLHRRAPPTASPTPRACRSRSAPGTPTTRCSCTAASAWARRT